MSVLSQKISVREIQLTFKSIFLKFKIVRHWDGIGDIRTVFKHYVEFMLLQNHSYSCY